MVNLWSANTPAKFWICQPNISDEIWNQAILKSIPILGLQDKATDLDDVLASVLGEKQFGSGHWQLSSLKRLYYAIKPILPCSLRHALRRIHRRSAQSNFLLSWPVEDRYVQFQWQIVRQLMIALEQASLPFRHFWPAGNRFAVVLTHDIETTKGQNNVRKVVDLEEQLGFRSSFNFVPERYALDFQLMNELRERGFEIGVHGLSHDGKLFSTQAGFMERATKINSYLNDFGAVGFRSPLTMRNPDWMQALEIEYELSFFDADPYEPIPGGCMSIWPFMIGHFVELPYTLPQDCTLTVVLNQNTPRIWKEKLEFIKKYFGMALVNTHPDYLQEPVCLDMYEQFLQTVKEGGNYWLALPREVASWWRRRAETPIGQEPPEMVTSTVLLGNNEQINLILPQYAPIEWSAANPVIA